MKNTFWIGFLKKTLRVLLVMFFLVLGAETIAVIVFVIIDKIDYVGFSSIIWAIVSAVTFLLMWGISKLLQHIEGDD